MGCILLVTEKDLREFVASFARELQKSQAGTLSPEQRALLAKYEAESRSLTAQQIAKNHQAWVDYARRLQADPKSTYNKSPAVIGTHAHKSGFLTDWAIKQYPDATAIMPAQDLVKADGRAGKADLVIERGDGKATVVEFFTGHGQANYKVNQVGTQYGKGSLREQYKELDTVLLTLNSYDDKLAEHAHDKDVEVISPEKP